MKLCEMCKREATLQSSHAIPDTVFRRILRENSGKLIVVPGGGSDPVHYSSDTWDTEQLCKDCETLLNTNYESYSIRVLRGKVGAVGKHPSGVTFKNVDTRKLASFFISIFWRAANSDHESYSKVYIPDPWNDQIRALLSADKAVPRSLVTVKISRLCDETKKGGFSQENLKSMLVSPFLRRYRQGHYSFCFILEGFFIENFIPGLRAKPRRAKGVLSNRSRFIVAPFLNIFDIPELKECLVEGYRKYMEGSVTFKS